MNWSIDYQDVIAVGCLLLTGKLWTDRVVSLAGPKAKNPRYVKTRLGAKISELVENEVKEGAVRKISGSILNGSKAEGALDYLGRYNLQVSLLQGRNRERASWMANARL